MAHTYTYTKVRKSALIKVKNTSHEINVFSHNGKLVSVRGLGLC